MQNVLTTDLLETFLLLPHIYLLMSLQLFLIVLVISKVLGVAIFGSRLSKKYHKDIEMQGVSPTEVARCAKRNVVGHPASLCVRECVRACVRKEGRGGKKKERELFAATHEDPDRLLLCVLLFRFHMLLSTLLSHFSILVLSTALSNSTD